MYNQQLEETFALISKKIEDMLVEDKNKLMLPAEEVAIVGTKNTLEHALLVLTNVGYTVIPALDEESKVKGIISIPTIIRAVTGIESFQFEKLSEKTVEEYMKTDFPTLPEDFELDLLLHLLVRHSFVCVIDDEGVLKGIITRSELLKGTNRVAHLFETKYHVVEKEVAETEVIQ